jgi:hypothetical protein
MDTKIPKGVLLEGDHARDGSGLKRNNSQEPRTKKSKGKNHTDQTKGRHKEQST